VAHELRLSNAGESLILAGPGSVVLHAFAPEFPPQRPNISYGILAGDTTLAQYLGIPTPGAPNNETLPPPLPVRLSHPGRTFTEPFTVSLAAEHGAEIRFTLDGSAPDWGGDEYDARFRSHDHTTSRDRYHRWRC